MILVFLLIPLTLAFAAVCVIVNSTDEIVKVAAACTALLCLFFSLVFAPLWLKVLIVLIPVVSKKLPLSGISAIHR